MSSLTVSVIIPTYNRAHCIADAVRSVINQSREVNQIIVIDDGSSDSTDMALASFGDQIEVVKKANGGVSSARNAGLDRAKGDIVAFLDSDDTWEKNTVERTLAVYDSSPGCTAVVMNCLMETTQGWVNFFDKVMLTESPSSTHRNDSPVDLVLRNCAMLPAFSFRRTEENSLLRFRSRMQLCEDLEFMSQVAMTGYWMVCHEVGVRVRRVSGPALTNIDQRDTLSAARYRFQFINSLRRTLRIRHISQERLLPESRVKIASVLFTLAGYMDRESKHRSRRVLLIHALRADRRFVRVAKIAFVFLFGSRAMKIIRKLEMRGRIVRAH
jgi:glycosyltransferase involved in cell wall biosynthesis